MRIYLLLLFAIALIPTTMIGQSNVDKIAAKYKLSDYTLQGVQELKDKMELGDLLTKGTIIAPFVTLFTATSAADLPDKTWEVSSFEWEQYANTVKQMPNLNKAVLRKFCDEYRYLSSRKKYAKDYDDVKFWKKMSETFN